MLLKRQTSERYPAQSTGGRQGTTGEITDLKGKVLSQRAGVAQARVMQSDIDNLRTQYRSLKSMAQALKGGQDIEGAAIVAYGAASVPLEPVFPNLRFTVPAAILLGLILGFECSLLVELLGRRVRSQADIEVEGVPLLGRSYGTSRTTFPMAILRRLGRRISKTHEVEHRGSEIIGG